MDIVGYILLFVSLISDPQEPAGPQLLTIYTVETSDSVSFYADNETLSQPLTASIDLSLDNMVVSDGSIGPIVLEGGAEGVFWFTVTAIDTSSPWEWLYTYQWARGDYTARHNDEHIYQLPFYPEKSFYVSQGCDGTFSHQGVNRYSLDFPLPVGTEILAARGGRVVDVKEDSDIGGPSRKYLDDGNYVVIEHSDLTHAYYFHLKQDGAVVSIGQTVRTGQLIGLSGNTGFSSGPHLHFSVAKAAVDPNKHSIPVKMNIGGKPVTCAAAGTILFTNDRKK